MATITLLAAGSVVKAVTAGSHDGWSLNRVRRSSGESLWTSMKSARLMDSVRASRLLVRRSGQLDLISPSP